MHTTQSHMCRCSKVEYKNIHVIIKCERSELEKIEIKLSRAKML